MSQTFDSNIKTDLINQYQSHYNFIKNERFIYKQKTIQAQTLPKQYLSIIIDGSDMACYGFPYFYQKSKSSTVGYKIQIKLVGVIVHGIRTFVYLIHKHWPSDPNLTIELLHRTLNKIGKHNLPPILYLQV